MTNGYIFINGKKINMGEINWNVNNGKDYTYSNMDTYYTRELNKTPRFEPSWVPHGEYFIVGDYRNTPKKIKKDTIKFSYDDRQKVDLDLCRKVCDMLNQLDISYLEIINELVNRAEYWKNCYSEVNERNQKLEKLIIEKEINDVEL